MRKHPNLTILKYQLQLVAQLSFKILKMPLFKKVNIYQYICKGLVLKSENRGACCWFCTLVLHSSCLLQKPNGKTFFFTVCALETSLHSLVQKDIAVNSWKALVIKAPIYINFFHSLRSSQYASFHSVQQSFFLFSVLATSYYEKPINFFSYLEVISKIIFPVFLELLSRYCGKRRQKTPIPLLFTQILQSKGPGDGVGADREFMARLGKTGWKIHGSLPEGRQFATKLCGIKSWLLGECPWDFYPRMTQSGKLAGDPVLCFIGFFFFNEAVDYI